MDPCMQEMNTKPNKGYKTTQNAFGTQRTPDLHIFPLISFSFLWQKKWEILRLNIRGPSQFQSCSSTVEAAGSESQGQSCNLRFWEEQQNIKTVESSIPLA
jgi:hypothetical protein